jgi:hypothetical protein
LAFIIQNLFTPPLKIQKPAAASGAMKTERRRHHPVAATTTATGATSIDLLEPEERARLERVASLLRSRRSARRDGASGGAAGLDRHRNRVRYLSKEPADGDVSDAGWDLGDF